MRLDKMTLPMLLLKALAVSGWIYAGSGITQGISGLAVLDAQPDVVTMLAVRDNKKPDESRLATVVLRRGFGAQVTEAGWPDANLPIDLEAISAIPGQPRKFIAMTSAGKCYRLSIGEGDAKVEGIFDLPGIPEKANFEGFSLAKVGPATVAVWGERGELPKKSQIYWAEFASDKVSEPPQSAELDVPWPTATGSRGISDLKLDSSGTLFITAAADFGDDGPFQSGLFVAGTITPWSSSPAGHSGSMAYRPSAMTRLAWFEGRKIEALEFVPGKTGGMIFGTDDENLGGSIWQNLWPTD